MWSSSLCLFAISTVVVNAFQDTSPFIFFSSSEILASSPQIASAASIDKTISTELGKCPSDIYVIVTQPGASAEDYKSTHSSPYLSRLVSGQDKQIRSSFSVANVLGEIDVSALSRTLENRCGVGTLHVDASTGLFDMVDDMKPRIIKVDFPELPTGAKRSAVVKVNDIFLSNLLDMIPSTKYSVIYTTTPVSSPRGHDSTEPSPYEMDQPMSPLVHMDLKRDIDVHGRAASNETSLPLFEKYQYFTPGLFMALFVSFILLSILYVGITALASLQVSYAAFDRENGPAAQKK